MSDGQITPDQMGLLVASILSRKGGADLSSALSDPFLAYLSGASSGQNQLSEGELYARYAPTFLFIAENEPEGSWRKQAAALLSTGVPAYRVKEQVQSFLASNPDQQGLSTSKDVDSFIEGLAKEYQTVQTEAVKQRENDPFTKAGYPSPDKQYTEEDIVRLAPEAFSSLQQRAEAARPQFEKLIAGIDAKYSKPVMKVKEEEATTSKKKSSGRAYQDVVGSEQARLIASNTIARQFGIPQSQVLNPNKSDRTQVAANQAFLAELEKNAQTAKSSAESGATYGGIPSAVGKAGVAGAKAVIKSQNPVIGALMKVGELLSKPHRSTEAVKQKQEEAQPEMVEDKAATARNTAIADVAKNLLSRRVGMPGYYEQAMGLLAQNIQSDLAKSGRTPLGDALIKSALLARATRKNG